MVPVNVFSSSAVCQMAQTDCCQIVGMQQGLMDPAIRQAQQAAAADTAQDFTLVNVMKRLCTATSQSVHQGKRL